MEAKIDLIECGGTAYEIGRQYGEARPETFRKASELFFGALSRSVYRAGKGEIIDAAENAYLEVVRLFDADAIEMTRGQADGAGLDFREAFALQCVIELSLNYRQVAGLCTSFAVTGSATANGQTLLGQNIDWHPEAPVDLLRIKDAEGGERLSLCLAGNAYYHLSSCGFGNCANLTLSPPRRRPGDLPLGVYLPKAMRQPALQAALAILQESARGYGYYLLADADGRIVGLESVADDSRLLRPERDVVVHANHYEDEAFEKLDLSAGFIPCTRARGSRMKHLIAQDFGNLTPGRMMGFLADHDGGRNSVCKHRDDTKPPEEASETRGAFVMVPAERRMFLALGPPCESDFIELSL
jgi:isopenicillin-N N-acyltransferase like protein